MTRSYFLECVNSWDELVEMCRDYECNVCEDIIDSETMDDYVEEDVRESDCSWRELRDNLDDITTGYDYYRCDGTFDYVPMNDGSDFDEYKEEVLYWMDDNGMWDEEEEEEPEDDDDFFVEKSVQDDEQCVQEEDFSVSELISMCGSELLTIKQAAERSRVEQEDAMKTILFAV